MNPNFHQLAIRHLPTLLFVLFPFSAVSGGPVSATLNPEEQKIVAYVDANCGNFAKDLEKIVQIDSATGNIDGVKAMAGFFIPQFKALHFDVPPPEAAKRAVHFVATRTGAQGKRLLLIGHLDTVLPGGNFSLVGTKAFGAGTLDMKGGDLVLLYALRALDSVGALQGTTLNVIMTGDEEKPGHPFKDTRTTLRDLAAHSDLCLAFEPTMGATAIVARRGRVEWNLEVRGETGHSAQIFSTTMGSGSVFETARILSSFYDELGAMNGITCNAVLVCDGAEALTNVIPQRTRVIGDLRFPSAKELDATQTRMQAIAGGKGKNLPKTLATLCFDVDLFPAMEPTPANYALLAQLDQVSRDLGFGAIEAVDPKARGAGDISFVSPPLPGLDGLGLRGEGWHTHEEFADLASAPELIKRTAVLIYRLTR
jgi:glutamate carboxypeptidase